MSRSRNPRRPASSSGHGRARSVSADAPEPEQRRQPDQRDGDQHRRHPFGGADADESHDPVVQLLVARHSYAGKYYARDLPDQLSLLAQAAEEIEQEKQRPWHQNKAQAQLRARLRAAEQDVGRLLVA